MVTICALKGISPDSVGQKRPMSILMVFAVHHIGMPVDEHLRAAPHIWAMGDVAGSPQFTYISLDDWRIVRDQLFGQGQRSTVDRAPFPTAVFTQPPLAHIGLTEAAARQAGRNIKVATLKAEAIPKAKILGQTDGLLKAVTDAGTGEILGVTLLCAESHEIINLFKMAIDHRILYAAFSCIWYYIPPLGALWQHPPQQHLFLLI